MKSKVILIGLLVCWVACMSLMTDCTDAAETWGKANAKAVAAADTPAGEKVEADRKFSRDCRKLGVNRRSIRKIYKQIEADGDVDMTDREAVADAIENEFLMNAMANPAIDWQNIDWDKLFEFISKIIALFMSFSHYFGLSPGLV